MTTLAALAGFAVAMATGTDHEARSLRSRTAHASVREQRSAPPNRPQATVGVGQSLAARVQSLSDDSSPRVTGTTALVERWTPSNAAG